MKKGDSVRKILNIFIFCFLMSIWGCYTTMKHPNFTNRSQNISHKDIQVVDNCAECHDNNLTVTTILPNSAYHDHNWHFYSQSSWWQDEEYVDTRPADNYLPPTGPRLRGDNATQSNRAVRQAPAPGPSLSKVVGGKTVETEEKENQDNRRDFQRRKETQEEKKNRPSKRKPR